MNTISKERFFKSYASASFKIDPPHVIKRMDKLDMLITSITNQRALLVIRSFFTTTTPSFSQSQFGGTHSAGPFEIRNPNSIAVFNEKKIDKKLYKNAIQNMGEGFIYAYDNINLVNST